MQNSFGRRLIELLLLFTPLLSSAQIDWDNYATSFMGSGKEAARPVLAIG